MEYYIREVMSSERKRKGKGTLQVFKCLVDLALEH